VCPKTGLYEFVIFRNSLTRLTLLEFSVLEMLGESIKLVASDRTPENGVFRSNQGLTENLSENKVFITRGR
jgi:hypothetical protein